MRTQRIDTHFACNQGCTYCVKRRAHDDPAYASGAAVRARIDAALAQGATELTFSGGEPGMRRDLSDLVRHAKLGGAAVVRIETNATLFDSARAVALRAAGLDVARVNLTAWGEALDRLTRDPGGFQRTLHGIEALQAAGVPVELLAAVVRSTVAALPVLPAHLAQRLGDLRDLGGLEVQVPVESPDPAELVSYAEAAAVLVALDKSARPLGLSVRVAPDSGPPPCLFPQLATTGLHFSLTPGARRRPGHRQLEACEACQMRDRCSGLPEVQLTRFTAPTLAPIVQDRLRRRLSVVSTVQAQVDREFVQVNRAQPDDGSPVEIEHLIRVQFHCNQACRFCFVSTHLPTPDDARIERQVVASAQQGACLVFTGGEPTLHPRLLDFVRLARAHSLRRITLQSNAIRLADPALAVALEQAGVTELFVSLHGCTAEVSDAVTETPGSFAQTVAGLDTVHRVTTVPLLLNFVLCGKNHWQLPAHVRWLHARWPRARLNLSFVAPSSDVVPRESELVPRYADVLPDVVEALKVAAELGVDVVGFESMCGLPLCLVPADVVRHFRLDAIPPGYDAGEFVRGQACDGCDLVTRCFGLRRGYLALHGDGELRRVSPPTPPPAER